ncbi:MAG TPA: asparaginase [Bacteroidia bacterium]|nr:asparaginase [Bacteroidia bacterium]
MKNRKNILIIYTGGTIGMMKEHRNQSLVPVNFKEIIQQVPELLHLNCKIDFHASQTPIDSSNVTPEFWEELALVIEKKYERYDGFVILHGTDTMAYTASALSFMLQNLGKPVILTGSQLPVGVIRTDARRNLITSIEIASSDRIIPEVCIYFSNQLYRGNRAEKYTSSKFDAFQSSNYPALADAGVNIVFHDDFIRGRSRKKFHRQGGFDTNIALLKIYPGIHTDVIDSTLRTPGLRAAVLETFGSGNAPTDPAFVDVLDKAIRRGIVLLNVSQCSGGTVDQGKYETSMQLKKIGVISGRDITTEAALTKLMFLFGQPLSRKQVEKLLQENLEGEMADK